MYVVHCAVDCTASIAGGLISFDIDASLIYNLVQIPPLYVVVLVRVVQVPVNRLESKLINVRKPIVV